MNINDINQGSNGAKYTNSGTGHIIINSTTFPVLHDQCESPFENMYKLQSNLSLGINVTKYRVSKEVVLLCEAKSLNNLIPDEK